MNLKEAKKLKPGTIVRESWNPRTNGRKGIVLSKNHVIEEHTAKVLCQKKNQRYDMFVYWFDGARQLIWRGESARPNPEKCQSWELMVVSHNK